MSNSAPGMVGPGLSLYNTGPMRSREWTRSGGSECRRLRNNEWPPCVSQNRYVNDFVNSVFVFICVGEITVALPKIEKLSYNQLIELKDTIEATIEQRRADEQAALKEKMAEMAAEAGFDLEDVLPAKRGGKGRKGGTVAPKYRNPKDPSQTWTGRGRQPKWLVAELGKGRKLESFLIQ